MNIHFKYDNRSHYPWQWNCGPLGPEHGEMYRWLMRMYPLAAWRMQHGVLSFRQERDANWFKLRWS